MYLLSNLFQRKGGDQMSVIAAFTVSVAAGVICYYICKWLDRNDNDS
jgi:hypothetical protein